MALFSVVTNVEGPLCTPSGPSGLGHHLFGLDPIAEAAFLHLSSLGPGVVAAAAPGADEAIAASEVCGHPAEPDAVEMAERYGADILVRRFMLAATQAMPVRPLPSTPQAPAPVGASPPRSGGGFFETVFGLFGRR